MRRLTFSHFDQDLSPRFRIIVHFIRTNFRTRSFSLSFQNNLRLILIRLHKFYPIRRKTAHPFVSTPPLTLGAFLEYFVSRSFLDF
jgi:hypothetical protein